MAGATKLMTAGGGGVTLTPASSIASDVTVSVPVVSGTLGLAINGVPAGAVMHFAMSSAPSGWLAADGSAVSRTTYATLFSAIGTTFGTGDGSTTFNVPNLGGQFIRSWESGQTTDSGRTFGSSQTDALKSHTHTTTLGRYYGNGVSGNSGWSCDPAYLSTLGLATGDASTGASTETRPVNVALLACIKY